MNILIKFKKFISLTVTGSLLLSFVIEPRTIIAMTNEQATHQYKQIFKDFMLPYGYGQITDAHYAGTDRVIVNIQDLHCHPKVQKNISNIIELFDNNYGVKKVYLEGAYGQLNTNWITENLQKAQIKTVLEKMLETGRLTGAEYYSVISGKTNIINGLEEKEPYLDNLKRFGNIVENQEKINLILKSVDESILELKKTYYTKRQYKLEELANEYKLGKITPQKYYTLLSKHIDKLGIALTKYENTLTYITLLELQKSLEYSKITTELQNLLLLLRENLAPAAYQLLLDNTENLTKIDKLYGYIVRISRQLNLDLNTNFPNLDNYFGYIELSQKINPLELIVEEEKLKEEINTRFSQTKAQREVVFLTNFEKYLKDYLTSKITADDYEYYKKNINTYKQLWNKYVDNRLLSLLDEYISEADKFYKINADRNIYFTNNMFQQTDTLNKLETEIDAKDDINKIIENMKGVKEVDVVITGGFHSQTVTEILKNRGVSYIVITPNVTDGTKLAEETYYKIAKEQSKISFQTLATLPFSAYPETLRINATVKAFGADIAKEIFPNKIAEIDSIDYESFTSEEQEIAQQMKKLRLRIEESKFLESDDKNLVDVLTKINDTDIDEDLLRYINLQDLKRILNNEEIVNKVTAIKFELKKATDKKKLMTDGNAVQKLIAEVKEATQNILSKLNLLSTNVQMEISNLEQKRNETYTAINQAIEEIKLDPGILAMQDEFYDKLPFDILDLELLKEFINTNRNTPLGKAVIHLFEDRFDLEDYNAFRNYIYKNGLNDVGDKDRQAQIKLLARVYAYISFKKEFLNQGKTDTITANSIIDIEGHEIKLAQWVHICDGHSLCTNGNEVGSKGSLPSVYSSTQMAFSSAITLEKLKNMRAVKEYPNIVIVDEDGRVTYGKEIEENGINKIYILVENFDGTLITFYVMDPQKAKTDQDGNIKDGYIIRNFIENKIDSKNIFIRDSEVKYDFTGLEQRVFIIKENELFRSDGITKVMQDSDGILNLNETPFFGIAEGHRIYDNRNLRVIKINNKKYFYNKDNKSWYTYDNNNRLIGINSNTFSDNLTNLKGSFKFKVDGKEYIFIKSMNMFFSIDESNSLTHVDKENISFKETNGVEYFICYDHIQNKNHCIIVNPINKVYNDFILAGNNDNIIEFQYETETPENEKKEYNCYWFKSNRLLIIFDKQNNTVIDIKNNYIAYSRENIQYFEINNIYYSLIRKAKVAKKVEVNKVTKIIVDGQEYICLDKDLYRPETETITIRLKKVTFIGNENLNVFVDRNIYYRYLPETKNIVRVEHCVSEGDDVIGCIVDGYFIHKNSSGQYVAENNTDMNYESSDSVMPQASSQLTMTWLENLLDKFKIKDFNKRQQITNTVENPIILTGLFVPFIKSWFIRQHKNQERQEVSQNLNTILSNTTNLAKNIILSLPANELTLDLQEIAILLSDKKIYELNIKDLLKIFTNKRARQILKKSLNVEHKKFNKEESRIINISKNREENSKYEQFKEFVESDNSDENKIKIIYEVVEDITRIKDVKIQKDIVNIILEYIKKSEITNDEKYKIIIKVLNRATSFYTFMSKNFIDDKIIEDFIEIIKNFELTDDDKYEFLRETFNHIERLENSDTIFDFAINFFETTQNEQLKLQLLENCYRKIEYLNLKQISILFEKSLSFINTHEISISHRVIYLCLHALSCFNSEQQKQIYNTTVGLINKLDVEEYGNVLLKLIDSIKILQEEKNDILNISKDFLNKLRRDKLKLKPKILKNLLEVCEFFTGTDRLYIFIENLNYISINQGEIDKYLLRNIIKKIHIDEFNGLSLEQKNIIVKSIIKFLREVKIGKYDYDIGVVRDIIKNIELFDITTKDFIVNRSLEILDMPNLEKKDKKELLQDLFNKIDLFNINQKQKISKTLEEFELKFSFKAIGNHVYTGLISKIKGVSSKVENKNIFFNIVKGENYKESKNLFEKYKMMEKENIKLLTLLTNLSSEKDTNEIYNLLKDMIKILQLFNATHANKLSALIDDFFTNKNILIENQTQLHGYNIDTISSAKDITINDLINVVHQTSINDFKYIMSYRIKTTGIQNFSQDGYINPEIKKLLFELQNILEKMSEPLVCFDENTLIMSLTPYDRHSMTVIVNMSETNKSISFSFYDAFEYRNVTISEILKKLGFNTANDGGFIHAKIDKDTGLTDDVDFVGKFSYIVKLFVAVSQLDIEKIYTTNTLENFIKKFLLVVDEKINMRDIASNYTFDRTIEGYNLFNKKSELDTILESLGLPVLPEDDNLYYEISETGTKILGQEGIYKFNEEIIRGFTRGQIIIDSNDELVKNDNYNLANEFISLLNQSNGKIQFNKNIDEINLLELGTIINQLDQRKKQLLKLKTEMNLGGYNLQTGYLELSNGTYLDVKVLKNPINSMIRYSKVTLLDLNGTKKELTADELIKILGNEGYNISKEKRLKSEQEKANYLSVITNKIEQFGETEIDGKVLWKNTKNRVIGKIIFDSTKVEKDSILLKEYLEPNDMEGILNSKGIIVMSGTEGSHAGLIAKEKGKNIAVISNTKIIEKNGKLFVQITINKPVGKVITEKGIQIQKTEEEVIEVEEGEYVCIDNARDKVIVLGKDFKMSEKEVEIQNIDNKEKQDIEKENGKVKEERKQTEGLDENVKGFDEQANEDNFGTKSTNLYKMFNVISKIKEYINKKIEVMVPYGIMVGESAFYDMLNQKAGYKQIVSEYLKAVEEGNFKVAIDKAEDIKRIIDTVTKEEKQDLYNKIKEKIKNARSKGYIKKNALFAVRSTFIGEDGKKYSSAGVGESIIGLQEDEIVDKLIDVLKSIYSERSVKYQCSNGQVFLPSALIQEAVDSQKSLVMFVTKDDIKISGAYGLGESVVSGKNIQSEVLLDKKGNVVEYITKKQSQKIGLGNKIETVNYEDSSKELFTEEELLNLAEIGNSLQEEYGYDADIEIAIDNDGTIHVLQIRPITYSLSEQNENLLLQTNNAKKILNKIGQILHPIDKVKAENFHKTSLGVAIGALLEARQINSIFLGQESKQEFLERHTSYTQGSQEVKRQMEEGLDGILVAMQEASIKALNNIPTIFKPTFIAKIAIKIAVNIANVKAHIKWNLDNENIMVQVNEETDLEKETDGEIETELETEIDEEMGTQSEIEIDSDKVQIQENDKFSFEHEILSDSEEKEQIEKDLKHEKYEIFYLEDLADNKDTRDRIYQTILDGKYFVIYPYRKGELPKTIKDLKQIYSKMKFWSFLEYVFPKRIYPYNANYKFVDGVNSKHFIFRYLIKEILKNAFVHGNNLNFTKPIYLKFGVEENSVTVSILNRKTKEEKNKMEFMVAKEQKLHGLGLGRKQAKRDCEYKEEEWNGLLKVEMKDIYGKKFINLKHFVSEIRNFSETDIYFMELLKENGFEYIFKDSIELYKYINDNERKILESLLGEDFAKSEIYEQWYWELKHSNLSIVQQILILNIVIKSDKNLPCDIYTINLVMNSKNDPMKILKKDSGKFIEKYLNEINKRDGLKEKEQQVLEKENVLKKRKQDIIERNWLAGSDGVKGNKNNVPYVIYEEYNKWKAYIDGNSTKYSLEEQCFVLDVVTDIEVTNVVMAFGNHPPLMKLMRFFEKEVLNETIEYLREYNFHSKKILTYEDKKNLFNREYTNRLRKKIVDELYEKGYVEEDKYGGKWVKIPQIINEEDGGVVKYLYILSARTWCTQLGFNSLAYDHLEKGKFYIYLDRDNQPQIGIRFKGDEIVDIASFQNDQRIPVNYLPQLYEEFLKKDNVDINLISKEQNEDIKELKAYINKINKNGDIKQIASLDKFEILKFLGFEPQVIDGDKISINGFKPYYRFIDFKELGIDENSLFENVTEIRGDIDVSNILDIRFPNVEKIEGNIVLEINKVGDEIKYNNRFRYLFPKYKQFDETAMETAMETEIDMDTEIEYSDIAGMVLAGINPIKTLLNFIIEFFDNPINLEGRIIMVPEGQEVSVPENVTKVNYKINEGIDNITRGGAIIGVLNGKTIRAYKQDNTIIFYSKQGLQDITQEQIEELFTEAISSGIKDGLVKENTIVAFAESTDTTIVDIENRLEIARKQGIIKSDTEIKFDLRKSKFSTNVCDGEFKSTGANTFIITQEQALENEEEIEKLRQDNKYRFVVSFDYKNIPSIIGYDGIQIDCSDIKEVSQLISVLEKLGKMCNVEKTISVVLNENLEIGNLDIFQKYGVLPIVNVKNVVNIEGKKEVNEITENTNIEQLLNDVDIVGVIGDNESRSILSVIKDLIKIKTNGYEKGLNVGLRQGQICDILKLKSVLIKGEIELADVSELDLQDKDRIYLEYLLEKENNEEAFGFVMGIAMNTMKQQWKTKFTNLDDKLFIEEAKGKYEKGLLMLMVSMKMSGVNIEELLNSIEQTVEVEGGWNVSAQEMYRIIGEKAYAIITRVLNENDKKIKILSSDEIVRAKEDFKDLNILIQDRFRVKETATEVKISALAIKSILTAA